MLILLTFKLFGAIMYRYAGGSNNPLTQRNLTICSLEEIDENHIR